MVLWDHYSPMPHGTGWVASTSLFIVISGVTTSLQLRSPLRLLKTYKGNIIQIPRESLNHKSFLLSRAIGIFPVLWISLLMSIPSWIDDTNQCKGVFAALYVLCIQSWKPVCQHSGPNVVIYGSIIWNVFMIYTFFRMILNCFQNKMLRLLQSSTTYWSDLFRQATYNNPKNWPISAWLLCSQIGSIAILLYIAREYSNVAKVNNIVLFFSSFIFYFLFLSWF